MTMIDPNTRIAFTNKYTKYTLKIFEALYESVSTESKISVLTLSSRIIEVNLKKSLMNFFKKRT